MLIWIGLIVRYKILHTVTGLNVECYSSYIITVFNFVDYMQFYFCVVFLPKFTVVFYCFIEIK